MKYVCHVMLTVYICDDSNDYDLGYAIETSSDSTRF